MKLVMVMIVAVLSLILLTSSSEAWFFGSRCGRRCHDEGSKGGRRYTSRTTGIKYCLCDGPTRFLPRQRRVAVESGLQDRLQTATIPMTTPATPMSTPDLRN